MTSAGPETSPDSRAARGLSLRHRLIGMVVLAILAGAAVGVYVDYRREHRVHLESVFASLQEQARTLQVARRRITDADAFAAYVDEFCAQMNVLVSPGHHILVLDAPGQTFFSCPSEHCSENVANSVLIMMTMVGMVIIVRPCVTRT